MVKVGTGECANMLIKMIDLRLNLNNDLPKDIRDDKIITRRSVANERYLFIRDLSCLPSNYKKSFELKETKNSFSRALIDMQSIRRFRGNNLLQIDRYLLDNCSRQLRYECTVSERCSVLISRSDKTDWQIFELTHRRVTK